MRRKPSPCTLVDTKCRWLAGVVVIALAISACGDSSDQATRPSTSVPPGAEEGDAHGGLTVAQRRAGDPGRRYYEGAVPFVRVTTGGETVLGRRFPRAREDSLLFAERLAPGSYLVETYVRPGSGGGRPPRLDPPTDRCRATVDLPASGSVTATILRTPGRPCEIRLQRVTFDDLVSLEVEDARTRARRRGFDLRVVERNGEALPVTADLRFDRLNVAVVDGQVSGLRGIG